jgi:integrase
MSPKRRYVSRNPLRLIELPNDENRRLRVAFALEAEQFVDVLAPEAAVPYAIAFHAGLRRPEIHCHEWSDVLDGRRIGSRLLVTKSKSDAGTERRPPTAEPLRDVLARAWLRQGRPSAGQVIERSVMSGKLAERATKAWTDTGLARITLHECRHTYAFLLMASGYTPKEIMEFMGYADLKWSSYVKLLPQPGEHETAARLSAYIARALQGHS